MNVQNGLLLREESVPGASARRTGRTTATTHQYSVWGGLKALIVLLLLLMPPWSLNSQTASVRTVRPYFFRTRLPILRSPTHELLHFPHPPRESHGT